MRKYDVRRAEAGLEKLEKRRLLASAGQLLSTDFNTAGAWPLAASSVSAGVTATAATANVGTIDVAGGTVANRTGAMNFAVSSAPASGGWRSDFTSGQLNNPNTGTAAEINLGKLTVGFSLSTSQARTVRFRVISYDANGQSTGALETDLSPAVADAFERYSVDLSAMKPSGAGTFNPAAPGISFNFEIGSVAGWSPSSTPTLRVDNFQYSKPALYVSSINGSDKNNGKTETTAFATIQKAINASQAGDIIDVMGDTAHPYNVVAGDRNLITHGGTPAAWITIKNYPGQSPLIYSEGWAAIQIGNDVASTAAAIGYVEVRGLHLQGDSAKVGSRTAPDGAYDPTAANANQYGPYAKYIQPVNADGTAGTSPAGTGADSRTNGNGLSIDGSNEANKPHDIRFADNLVEDFPGGGIGAGSADRIQLEYNVARDNCYWDKYATSGISILSTYSFDGNTAANATYARLVRGNISSGNIHKEKWVRNSPTLTQYSDGNGIIIDYNHSTDNTVFVTNRTLVTDNLVYDNGGSGIHAFNANHVDIVNNTAYLNSASPYLQYGEIFANASNDVKIYNNILVAPVAASGQPQEQVNGGTKPTSTNGIVYKNNLYFGGNVAGWAADAYNVNNVTADPKFAVPSTTPATADFRLQSVSPAIDKALADALTPQKDLLGNVRNGAADIGAYEYYAATPTIVAAASALPTTVTGKATTLSVTAGDNDGPGVLTYTWSTTSKPAGAADATFDANAIATAKTVIATFSQAGTYTLLVTVRDAAGLTATSAVTVVVAQTLAGLTLTPANATVAAGGTQQYAVGGVDQFGQPMTAPAVMWSATGSGVSIDGNGLVTASATTGAFVVSATGGVFTATANGAVTDQTPPTLVGAVSRKTQGSAGVFDRILSLSGATPTVEPRVGGPTTLVLTFSEPIKAADGTLDANDFAVSNAAFASASIVDSVLTLNLANVTDASRVVVAFTGLSDLVGNAMAAGTALTVRALYGDVNGNGVVNANDTSLVKAASGQAITNDTYLLDVNGNGSINANDTSVVKSLSGDAVD